MKRIVLWGLGTVTTVVLLFGYRTSTEGAVSTAAPAAISAGTTGSSAASGSSGSDGSDDSDSTDTWQAPEGNGTLDATPTPSTDDSSSDGTVTGDSVDTQWGPVQVAITVSDGKITDVQVPVYPSNNGKDQEINSYALPQLIQETLDAQSADIDMVSGATVTSDGYIGSLQSALDEAGL
ncbi:FMN-binding protein [Nocardioides sp. Kera G14]|uniref:FMN-binding protein n=1 Tax=Nocardioides sp. Kera G14 TaxID=2884264 RepID=UPI001D108503|nr:FMN-binding protein [Nocardioides sp. Kera G14]UDY23435.1 FMN-binding protein [Nocardioides sp. Kera G14]